MTRFLKVLTYIKVAAIFCLIFITASLTSCGKDEPSKHDDTKVTRVVLIYAVNNSSLSYDFVSDRENMAEAMKSVSKEGKLLLYCTDNVKTSETYKQPVLFEATKKGTEVTWKAVKLYDTSVLSTDVDRMSTVICDALALYPNASYDLFFWGHGTAWYPSGDSKYNSRKGDSRVIAKSYGGEYTTDSSVKAWTSIDELADAIPDYKFDTIWFDCCYMSNIETIYQLRNKCNTYVGYATEIWDDGLPYQYVLPYMYQSTPDLTSAATALYNYYNDTGSPVTVAVCDISQIETVADATKAILATGSARPAKSELTCYSRSTTFSFYDFEQFIRLTALRNADTPVTSDTYNMIQAFQEALSSFVTCHYESDTDFNHRYWNSNELSGISTHYFTDSSEGADNYYRSLDWYKRVYVNN
jgi:hypothetical protein